MAPKKLALKSSINSINAKKKPLPKLKAILADPYKREFDKLIDNELSEFIDLISSEIKSSGTTGRLFAKQNNIQLGLGSSLRTIGNKKASCVIISQSIKPRFIIDQIGYFTKLTNSTVPVFIVDDWDNISAKLFEVKALVVVFPRIVSGKIEKWISKRTLPTESKPKPLSNKVSKASALMPPVADRKIDLSSMLLVRPSDGSRSFVPDVVVKPKPIQTNSTKEWTGDFISFSNNNYSSEEIMDTEEIDEEFQRKQDKALEVFKEIVKKSKAIKSEPKVINKQKGVTDKPHKPSVQKKVKTIVKEEWENDASYISLEVHKIQPNPNRKPKNKRKKKQKQNNKKP